MPLEIGNSTTGKSKTKEVEVIPVVVKVNNKIDKNRFYIQPITKEVFQNVSVGLCWCDNCEGNKNFKRVQEKAVCITCNYIINEY